MSKVLKLVGKIILVLVAVLVIFFIGIKIYFAANSGDDELLDNSHLIFETINIADEKNGWFELKKAEEKMYFPEDKSELINKLINGENWDQEIVDELAEKNLISLEYFKKSAEYEFIADPLKNNLSTMDLNPRTVLSSMAFYRNLNRLNLILAKDEIKKGNFKSGIDRFILSVEVANKIKDSSLTPIDYLMVLSVNNHNRLIISSVVSELAFRKDESILLQKELDKNKKNKESLANAFKSEFWNMKNGFMYINFEDLSVAEKEFIDSHFSEKGNFYLKPNKHVNALNDLYTRNIENSYKGCNDLVPFDESNHFEYSNPISLIFTENAISKILINMMDINWDSLQKKRCMEDFDIIDLQVKLASNAYKNDFKKYPLNIEEMMGAGYLVVKIPENINGWNVTYNKETGELETPK
ncbi:MAG: hypothetical protein WAV16_00835 [Candidatus Moraniibacteriota bacterium]